MDATNRIFRSLEALDAAERPLSLNEIQREVGCPLSSLAATLRTLVTIGYLHHDRSRRTYVPTVLLADLGGWVASRFAPDAAVRDAARAICDATSENVTVAHRNDLRVQHLYFVPGKDLVPSVRTGTTRLLCRSALGWALLTFLSTRAIQSIVRRTNAALPSEDRVDLEPLLAIVNQCRSDGFIHGEHLQRAGYAVIAMPIRTSKSELVVGVSGYADRIRKNEVGIRAAMRRSLGRVPV
jgi:IclR family KDG regulon transcriptional repressor